MKRWLAAAGLAVICTTRVGADVTITTTTIIEGGMAAVAGGAAPTVITRIKGKKSRTDVEMGSNVVATLVDLSTQRAIVLRPDQKTALVLEPSLAGAPPPELAMPKIETTVRPTGQTREINGAMCDEYAISFRMDMSSMAGGGNIPPDTAQALKDLRMNMTGSVWVAKNGPGTSEYLEFQAGAAKMALGTLASGGVRGMPSGMEQLITGFADAPGIPYLTELTMGIEGSGQIAEMMKQMGGMKIISRAESVSTEPLPDDLFNVPEGYTLVKQ